MNSSHLRIFVLMCVLAGSALAPVAAPAAAAPTGSNNSSAGGSSGGSGSSATATANPGGARASTDANLSSLRPTQVSGAPNATTGNRTGATAPNATNGSAGSGGGGIVGGVTGAAEGAWNYATPDVPSTEEIANDTATWAKNKTLNATQFMLGKSMNFIVGTSHPKNSGPHGIFGTPTNDPYKSLYDSVYGPFSFQYSVLILVILLFAMLIVMPYAGLASGGSYRIVQTGARILAALVLIMFWWPIGSMLSQFFDAVAMGIAPTPKELTTSMNGIFKLSLGPILAALAFYIVDFVEIMALAFIYAFRQAALIVFQFAMPLLLVFTYAGPHRRVRSMASTISWQYFSLLTMTVPTAFLMRIGFEAKWGFGLGPLGNAIISIALLGLALAVPIVFSIAAFRAPPAMQSLAYGAAGSALTQGSKAWNGGKGWLGPDGDDDDGSDGNEGTNQRTVYVEPPPAQERVAATDGGTSNYNGATARGPGPAPGGAIGDGSGGKGGTAERIRDFEQKSSGRNSGSAAAQTRHYNNQNDATYIESTVIDDQEDSE